MRPILLLILYAATSYAPLLGQEFEEQKPGSRIDFGVDSSVTSNYVWRGFKDYSGASLQNNVRLGWKGLRGSWWIETGAEPGSRMRVREHDFDLHYEGEIGKTSYSAGYIGYHVLLTRQLMHELYACISRGEKLVTMAAVYQNVGWPHGTYISTTLSRSFRLRPSWSVQISGSVGFNRKMYINHAVFSDATLAATFTRRLRERTRFSPTIGFSKGLDARYFSNHLYTGVTFSYDR